VLNSPIEVDDPVSPIERIVESWHGGVAAILAKEARRWGEYFLVSNVPQLLVLIGAASLFLLKGVDGRRVPLRLRGPVTGTLAAVVVIAFLDPHSASSHLTPLVPFMLVLLARVETQALKRAMILLCGAVLLSSAVSVALASRVALTRSRQAVGNLWMSDTLSALMSADRRYTVVGPTELWPYLPQDRNVLLVDLTRNPESFAAITGMEIVQADFVLVNSDLEQFGWLRVVPAMAPAMQVVINRPSYLTVLARVAPGTREAR
jgi:hypothetical protein